MVLVAVKTFLEMSAGPVATGDSITLIIPVHRARVENGMLRRALDSVGRQWGSPRVLLPCDVDGEGSAAIRTRALADVETEWVAFLDSDDELDADHLLMLVGQQRMTNADVVYPWFKVVGGEDPWPDWFGREFDAEALRRRDFMIPVTVLARTELVRAAGGFQADLSIAPPAQCDEWGLWLRMLDLGARFVHVPHRTWTWHRHGGNTAGSPLLGDAKREEL